MALSEKELDIALDQALRENPTFVSWFLSRLAHGNGYERLVKCRSDHPWAEIRIILPNPETGALQAVNKQGETDVLAVFENASGQRLGVHIENKLATGSFRPLQPELYAARAEHWVGTPDYGAYHTWETVLLAPSAFIAANSKAARKFTTRIPHEEVAELIPSFSTYACPLCGAPLKAIPRYPRYVCRSCVAKATAPDGRRLIFSNADVSGGYVAKYADSGQEYSSRDCFIEGTRCVAGEARFGGIVVEVSDR